MIGAYTLSILCREEETVLKKVVQILKASFSIAEVRPAAIHIDNVTHFIGRPKQSNDIPSNSDSVRLRDTRLCYQQGSRSDETQSGRGDNFLDFHESIPHDSYR